MCLCVLIHTNAQITEDLTILPWANDFYYIFYSLFIFYVVWSYGGSAFSAVASQKEGLYRSACEELSMCPGRSGVLG